MQKKPDGNNPTGGLNPKDNGWQIVVDMLEPDRYDGNSAPDSAMMMTKVIINTINQDEEYSSEWSKESDDSENDG